MVSSLEREVLQTAQEVLKPEGFKVRIAAGRTHHFVVVEKEDEVVARLSFSTSPRTNNSANWMRQRCRRWLKERTKK